MAVEVAGKSTPPRADDSTPSGGLEGVPPHERHGRIVVSIFHPLPLDLFSAMLLLVTKHYPDAQVSTLASNEGFAVWIRDDE